MSRSIEQIQEALKGHVRDINNSIDLQVGPTYSFMLAPVAPELALNEAEAERLLNYYSTSFATVATPDEALAFAVNFGTGPSGGGFAKGPVVFFRNSPPPSGSTFTIKVGDIVATTDRTLLFRVTKAVSMSADFASTYFNPSTNRYEVSTYVEAVAPGSVYNIPPKRITRLMSNPSGIDGVEQRTSMDGGTEPETISDVVARVQTRFRGLDNNSTAGILSSVFTVNPTVVLDAKLVRPTDRLEFRRITSGPALDICVSGQIIVSCVEEYLTIGGETSIPIVVNKTMTAVTEVLVDGAPLESGTWSFIPDTSREYQNSTAARPVVQLVLPISTGNSLVEVSGYKNQLLDDVQARFAPNEDSLFKTDILVRGFNPMPVQVVMEVRISSGDIDAVQGQIYIILKSIIQPETIPEMLNPEVIKDIIRGQVPQISSIKMLKFRRVHESINDVEIIVPLKNQQPLFDQISSNVSVRL